MRSRKSKNELLEVVQPRYLKANKIEKQKILDEFTSVTGYHIALDGGNQGNSQLVKNLCSSDNG